MSEEGKLLRLPVVAKEFNVSVNTIVDHLADKGFDVNPRSKVTEEMYQTLQSAFQKDAAIKEKAEKINFGKPNREDVVIEAPMKTGSSKDEDQQEVVIKSPGMQQQTPPPAAKKETPPAEKAPEKPEEEKADKPNKLEGPKIVGKVDLDPKPKAAKQAEAPKEEEKPKEEPKKEAPKKEEKAPEKEAPKAEPIASATPEPDTKAKIAPKKEEEDNDKVMKTEKVNLTGPKIVGRIELPTKPERPAKSTGGAAGGDDDKKKRRRKRIVRPGAGGGSGTGGGNDRSGGRGAGNRKNPREEKTEVSEKEIQDKIKSTLAKLGGTGGTKGKARAKIKKAKREDREAKAELETVDDSLLEVTEFISVSELASLMDVSATEVISKCMQLGIIVSINQRLDAEVIELVASEFDFEVKFTNLEDVEEEDEDDYDDDPEDLQDRAPIVTVMGHVDHGKTSLLDNIRKANVVSSEAGGITQHIGAYEVNMDNGKRIVFLDTPGHEAFTAMRARGAKVTDVAVIVIAADDQVMPQTKEAISHAQAAGVPMVFAFNKMDKEGANPEKIKEQLANMNLLVEDWGGKFQSQEISAKKGLNIDKLLEKIALEAEILELKANPDRESVGTIIEASLDKGRGYVATVLVSSGTLKMGDMVVAGTYYGKVKAMFNHLGERTDASGPSTAVQILGLNGAPQAGERFKVYETDSEAKTVTNKRQQILREQGLRTKKHITLDEIGRRLALGTFKELNVIIKGDFDGSVEALKDSLQKLSTEEIMVNTVHSGVGQITESDILLASASDAIIIGFQVRPSATARKLAEKENIEVRLYSVIYDAIEEIKTAMEGMLEPKIEETITGTLEIQEVFKITKVGSVAGCLMTDGKIYRTSKVRVIRDGIVVHTGALESLRRFKDEVKEVYSGQECGIKIKGYNDFHKGDEIEAYSETEVKRKL